MEYKEKWNIIKCFNNSKNALCSLIYISNNVEQLHFSIIENLIKTRFNTLCLEFVKTIDLYIEYNNSSKDYKKELKERYSEIKYIIDNRNKNIAHSDLNFNNNDILVQVIQKCEKATDILYNEIIIKLDTIYKIDKVIFDSECYRLLNNISKEKEDEINNKLKIQLQKYLKLNNETFNNDNGKIIKSEDIIAICYKGLISEEGLINRQIFCIEWNIKTNSNNFWVEFDEQNIKEFEKYKNIGLIDEYGIINNEKLTEVVNNFVNQLKIK